MNLKELNGKPFTLWLTDEGDESANPEDKSLSPDGKRCDAYIRGLLRRRPIEAMRPFGFVGKEIERRAQKGEDVSVLETNGPIQYRPGQTAKTRPADASLILRPAGSRKRRLEACLHHS